jgi:hypothetical protein
MNPFEIRDCALLTKMSGLQPALNLRELRDRISACSPNVLYHHFCETLLVPQFDYPDFRNDFAVWGRHMLRDDVLGERLGIIDPYAFLSLEELRGIVLEIIDERLSELAIVPWAPSGNEFYCMEATTVVFDTGERIFDPHDLSRAIGTMTNSSIYFHFLEARRRPPFRIDDFSVWLLEAQNEYQHYLAALQSIDFAFYTLAEIRCELVRALSSNEE